MDNGWKEADAEKPTHGGQVIVAFLMGNQGPFVAGGRWDNNQWDIVGKPEDARTQKAWVYAWKENPQAPKHAWLNPIQWRDHGKRWDASQPLVSTHGVAGDVAGVGAIVGRIEFSVTNDGEFYWQCNPRCCGHNGGVYGYSKTLDEAKAAVAAAARTSPVYRVRGDYK